jgi:PAS domain S-box-containing protein
MPIPHVRKSDLVRAFAQSMGVEAAEELLDAKLRQSGLAIKEVYSIEEVFRVVTLLIRRGGLIGVVAQTFTNNILSRQRQEAEERANRTEREAAEILDSANVGIMLLDAETHTLVDINAKGLSIFGFADQAMEGMGCRLLFGLSDRDPCPPLALGESIENTESAIVTRSGAVVPILLSIKAIRYKGRQTLLESFVDITPIKKVEQALREARQRAEEASKAKGQFLANMSHEIRTPINGIVGMCKLLLSTPLTDKQRWYVDTAIRSSGTLLTVINDVLDFSKIEAGKLSIEALQFNPRDVVDSVEALFADEARSRNLTLAHLIHPGVPDCLYGDPNRLSQVLGNLVGNALKFTEAGEVAVRVSVDEDRGERVVLRFAVSDTGIGIPEDQTEQLFSSFTQADSSSTRKAGGVGLGLAISRQLVDLMGGRIGVESRVGQGSTFWFTVDLEKAESRERVGLPGGPILLVGDLVRCWPEFVDGPCAGLKHDTASNPFLALERMLSAAGAEAPYAAVLITDDAAVAPEIFGEWVASCPQIQRTALALVSSEAEAVRPLPVGFVGRIGRPVNVVALERLMSAGEASPDSGGSANERSLDVLLAEDNSINQQVVLEILSTAGHRCACVDNGRKAVEAARGMCFDVILLDCQMPEMDGYEAARRIRAAHTGGPRTPMIALTAHAMKGDRERCIEAGMDDYLSKPIDPAQLIAVIQRWARRAGGADARSGRSESGQGEQQPAPVYDHDEVLERCRNRPDLVRKLVWEFIEQCYADAGTIERALRDDDATRLNMVAHGLKGVAANLSAAAITSVAEQLEQAGHRGDLSSGLRLLRQLREEVARFVAHVSGLDQLRPGS